MCYGMVDCEYGSRDKSKPYTGVFCLFHSYVVLLEWELIQQFHPWHEFKTHSVMRSNRTSRYAKITISYNYLCLNFYIKYGTVHQKNGKNLGFYRKSLYRILKTWQNECKNKFGEQWCIWQVENAKQKQENWDLITLLNAIYLLF